MKIKHTAPPAALASANRVWTLTTLGVANDRSSLNSVFGLSGDSADVVS